MSKLKVYNMQGAAVADVDVADGLLVSDKGAQAARDAVVATMAAKRAGTASTLEKGEVAGSNRKPWRQKGTGRARAGYRRSPVWKGGGIVFGPKPRDFGVKINRKVARLAFCRAFSERVAAGAVKVVEALELPEAKSKSLVAALSAMEVTGPALLVVQTLERNLALAARNVPTLAVAKAGDLCAMDVLRYPTIVIDRQGLDIVTRRLEQHAGRKA
jgi:large subunit ribosomal protein L4